MIIDDDKKLSTLIKDFLEPHKYHVSCFEHPKLALEKLKTLKPEGTVTSAPNNKE